MQRQTLDRPLRVWVPGCSTGEEAYSIAMLFLEQIAAAKRNIKLQVFASDIDADCVAFARNGIYPESIEADVTPTRLARFFTKEDHSYQVVRELRETVVFTGQSLLADAPFSRLDLVSCRNLLIYLNPEAQRKILSLFHFALREGGVLFLGLLRDGRQRFGSLRADQQEASDLSSHRSQPTGRGRISARDQVMPVASRQSRPTATDGARRPGFGELSQRALLDAYAPASVLINAKHEGLYYFGSVGPLSEGCLRRGHPGCACHGARRVARQAEIGNPARQTGSCACHRHGGASRSAMGARSAVSITALPVEGDGEDLFLVSFVDDPTPELETRQTG